ncbi:Stress response kinase A [Thalassocella blandensis]|nr:Stress response kinase A [Thalassocella blandensis]
MDQHDYAQLSPDTVLDAVESLGFLSDLRVLALNSYENRVYQVGMEGADPIIAKFYRPNRWTDEQIIEEHAFSLALSDSEIPIISPIEKQGKTLFEHEGFRFALYPRRGGYAPELEDLDTLYRIGQQLGRLHAVGQAEPFIHRPKLDAQQFGHASRDYILANNCVPQSLRESYANSSAHILEKIDEAFANISFTSIRLHGDCHPGNILSRPDSLYFVDLDDARSGPAIQDIWMLLSGDTESKRSQLASIIEGYEEFCEFNVVEFRLIEALRSLRLLHYTAWLARRWEDPAFPIAFPWFSSERYWADHIVELREQLLEMDAKPLSLQP